MKSNSDNKIEGCCPENSYPQLTIDYQPSGHIEKYENLEIYSTGNTNSQKAIILITDIFGPNSGRSKATADFFGSKGFYVIIPDVTRGDWFRGAIDFSKIMEWLAKYPWSYFNKELSEIILPFLYSKGKTDIGIIGFCWGAWYSLKACSTLDVFKCGILAHPSFVKVLGIFNEDVSEVIHTVKCKQLIIPASNDDDIIKEDGPVIKILQKNHPESETITFINAQHGWVLRSDLSKNEHKIDTEKALDLIEAYFQKHL